MPPTILLTASLADDVLKHLTALEEWSMVMLPHKALLAIKLLCNPFTMHQQLCLGVRADALPSS